MTVEETEIEQRSRLAALLDARLSALDDHGAVILDVGKEQHQRWPLELVVSQCSLWCRGADAIGKLKAWVARKGKEMENANYALVPLNPVKALTHWFPKSKALVPWVTQESKPLVPWVTQESKPLVPWVPVSKMRQTPVSSLEFKTWLDLFEWAREQQQIREASGFQDWKGPPLSLLQSLSAAELHELLRDKRLLYYFYGGSDCARLVKRRYTFPLTVKKITIMEWSIAKLVLSLLMYSSKPWDDPSRPTTPLLRNLLVDESIESKIDQLQERIHVLQSDVYCIVFSYGDVERPPFPRYDEMIVAEDEETREMNKSLHHLLVLLEQSTDPGDVISEICYNLLTARAPPDTETYNMLLLRFSLLGMGPQFTAVMTSMRQSKIRPNEITNATALLHFTRMADRDAFIRRLQLMEGDHGGLIAANREFIDHPLLWKVYALRSPNSLWAIKKARMNGQVYESAIMGAINFGYDDIAKKYYCNMISQGWSPTFGILLAILQDCCRKVDWAVGYEVLHQLEKTAEKMNTLTYEWMLRLCQRCRQHEFFDQILIDGVHGGALPASMLALTECDKAKDIGFLIECAQDLQPPKAIGRLEEVTIRIGHHLGYDSPYLTKNVFDGCKDQETLRQTVMRTGKSWRARYALERRLDSISRDIEYTSMQVSRALRVSEELFFVKYWLSKQVQQLEKDLAQSAEASQVSYTSYRDLFKPQRVQETQTRTSEDGNRESGNLGDPPLTTRSSENEAEYILHGIHLTHRLWAAVCERVSQSPLDLGDELP